MSKNSLEEKLFQDFRSGVKVDLEDALLIASGVDSEEKLVEYKKKLGFIEADFVKKKGKRDDAFLLARDLFNYFWETKPERYNGNFLLTDVIDAQLNPDAKGVGNCVGLTSLYSVVGSRLGLELKVSFIEADYDGKGHVFSRLCVKEEIVDIENTNDGGFNFQHAGETRDLSHLVCETYHSRGTVNYWSSRFDEAIADYDKAIELNPNYSAAYNNRGSAKSSLRRFEEAIVDYDKAVELKPEYANAYFNRGSTKYKLCRIEEAIVDYDKAIELNPDFAEAYNNRANSKYDLCRFEEAVVDYDKAVELNPDFVNAHYNRGNSKYELSRFDEAIQDYNRAIELKPDFVEAYYNRGNTNQRLRRFKEAAEDFKAVMDIRPSIDVQIMYVFSKSCAAADGVYGILKRCFSSAKGAK